jgi:hypothetical protein
MGPDDDRRVVGAVYGAVPFGAQSSIAANPHKGKAERLAMNGGTGCWPSSQKRASAGLPDNAIRNVPKATTLGPNGPRMKELHFICHLRSGFRSCAHVEVADGRFVPNKRWKSTFRWSAADDRSTYYGGGAKGLYRLCVACAGASEQPKVCVDDRWR